VLVCFCAISAINRLIHRRSGGAIWQGGSVSADME
jgi:hypothetical protein